MTKKTGNKEEEDEEEEGEKQKLGGPDKSEREKKRPE